MEPRKEGCPRSNEENVVSDNDNKTIIDNEVLLKRMEKIQGRASSFVAEERVLVYYLALDGSEIEHEKIKIGHPLMKPVMWKHISEKAKELSAAAGLAAIVFIADTNLWDKDGKKIGDALMASAFGPGINFSRVVEYKKVGSEVVITKTTVYGLDEETTTEWTYLEPWWGVPGEAGAN